MHRRLVAILTLSLHFSASAKRDSGFVPSGVRESGGNRIVGGVEAAPNELVYQVYHQWNGEHYCGGSIIAADWVLTAAHCEVSTDPSDEVVAGAHNIDNLSEFYRQVKSVEEVVNHPGFNASSGSNDVALVKITTPFDFSTGAVGPIKIARNGWNPGVGSYCTVSGWGRTFSWGPSPNVLLKAEVPIVSDEDCNYNYENLLTLSTMICAGQPGKDSCDGDSGGPLAQNGVLVGVVSFGFGCGSACYPGVYAQVDYFAPFIQQYVPDVQTGFSPSHSGSWIAAILCVFVNILN